MPTTCQSRTGPLPLDPSHPPGQHQGGCVGKVGVVGVNVWESCLHQKRSNSNHLSLKTKTELDSHRSGTTRSCLVCVCDTSAILHFSITSLIKRTPPPPNRTPSGASGGEQVQILGAAGDGFRRHAREIISR